MVVNGEGRPDMRCRAAKAGVQALMLALVSLACTAFFAPEAKAASCEVTSDGIAFSNIDTLGTGLQHSAGTIEVRCTDIQTEPATLCLKQNSLTALTNGDANIEYSLFFDEAGSDELTTSYGKPTPLTDDGSQWAAEVDIYAFISKNLPDSASGTYTGNVTVDAGVFEGGTPDCSGPAATSSSYPVTISGTVQDDCNILADDIDFGDVGLISSPVRRTGNVHGRCTLGTTYRIDLNDGENGTRRMISSGGDYLTYDLYQDDSYSERWGSGDQGVSAATASSGSGEYQHPVYAELPVQSATVGKYADTVTATIIYGSSLP